MQPDTTPANPNLVVQPKKKSNVVLLIALLCCIPFTFVCIQYCLAFGKLRHDVTYDDVNYYVYGLHLYKGFFQNGLTGLLQTFIATTPRAFYSAFAAALGFSVFGVTDWAPMAINIVIIVALVLAAYYLVKDSPWWVQTSAILYVFASPLSILAIIECRPDILAGLLLCSTPTYLFFANNSVPRRRDFAYAGALLGASYMAKSTIFPLIGVVGVATLGLGLTLRFIAEPCNRLKDIVLCFTFYVCTAILVAFPQLTNGWKLMLYYFKNAILGKEASVWKVEGTFTEMLLYYINGPGATSIASHAYITYAVGIIGIAWALISLSNQLRLAVAAWGVLYLINYSVLSIAGAKTMYLGMPVILFSFMLPILALHLLSYSKDKLTQWILLPIGCIALSSSILLLKPSRPIDSNTWMVANDGPKQKQINRDLLNIITSDFPKESGAKSIYLQTTGFINYDTLQWLSYRDNLPISTIKGAHPIMDLPELEKAARESDYTVAAEGVTIGTYTWYPSNKLGPELVASFDKASDMKRIGTVASLNGNRYIIYRNNKLAEDRVFAGWENPLNIVVYENPSLQGVGQSIEVSLRREPMEDATLAVDMYGKPMKTCEVVIYLNDKEVHRYQFKNYQDRLNTKIRLGKVNGGERLRFKFSDAEYSTSSDGKIFCAAFDELRIIPTPAPTPPALPAPAPVAPTTEPSAPAPSVPAPAASPAPVPSATTEPVPAPAPAAAPEPVEIP
ncbi:MAG TPA: glycosyltransferase family 39 protein [Candidatus Methylacidiphilales bacterium]|nr:glycosyltransferase family 39 protein [Candidatus Methylacidiphilales bacterium]